MVLKYSLEHSVFALFRSNHEELAPGGFSQSLIDRQMNCVWSNVQHSLVYKYHLNCCKLLDQLLQPEVSGQKQTVALQAFSTKFILLCFLLVWLGCFQWFEMVPGRNTGVNCSIPESISSPTERRWCNVTWSRTDRTRDGDPSAHTCRLHLCSVWTCLNCQVPTLQIAFLLVFLTQVQRGSAACSCCGSLKPPCCPDCECGLLTSGRWCTNHHKHLHNKIKPLCIKQLWALGMQWRHSNGAWRGNLTTEPG